MNTNGHSQKTHADRPEGWAQRIEAGRRLLAVLKKWERRQAKLKKVGVRLKDTISGPLQELVLDLFGTPAHYIAPDFDCGDCGQNVPPCDPETGEYPRDGDRELIWDLLDGRTCTWDGEKLEGEALLTKLLKIVKHFHRKGFEDPLNKEGLR